MNFKSKVLKINKITNISIFGGLSAILGWIDKIISQIIFPALPGVKLGIANLVLLVFIRSNSYKTTLLIVILKSILLCFIFGSITSFLIGGTASIISYLMMLIIIEFDKNEKIGIGVSIVGGIVHTIIQVLVIKNLYNFDNSIYIYSLSLLGMSFITSILTGIISEKLKKQLHYANLKYLDI